MTADPGNGKPYARLRMSGPIRSDRGPIPEHGGSALLLLLLRGAATLLLLLLLAALLLAGAGILLRGQFLLHLTVCDARPSNMGATKGAHKPKS